MTLDWDISPHGALVELVRHRKRLLVTVWTEMPDGTWEPSLMFNGADGPTAQAIHDAFAGRDLRGRRRRDIHPSQGDT